MRKLLVLHVALNVLFSFLNEAFPQSVSINNSGTSPDISAILDVQSIDKGILIPRMTMTQRNSIVSPATGLLVYQLDGNNGFYYNQGSTSTPNWKMLGRNKDTITVNKYSFKPRNNNIPYDIYYAGAYITAGGGDALYAAVNFPPGTIVLQMIIHYFDVTSDNLRIVLVQDGMGNNPDQSTSFSFLTSGSVSGMRTAIVNNNWVVNSNPYYVVASSDNGSWEGSTLLIRSVQFVVLH